MINDERCPRRKGEKDQEYLARLAEFVQGRRLLRLSGEYYEYGKYTVQEAMGDKPPTYP